MAQQVTSFWAGGAPPPAEAHTNRTGLIDMDRPEWWNAYTANVIEALARKDLARFNQECAEAQGPARATKPIATTRL